MLAVEYIDDKVKYYFIYVHIIFDTIIFVYLKMNNPANEIAFKTGILNNFNNWHPY